MANTIQIMLLDNKRADALYNGQSIAFEGGYNIVAGESNATIFELKSVPAQYKDATFTVTGYNSAQMIADDLNNKPIKVGDTFPLTIGMANAGYAQLLFSCVKGGETVRWLPIKFRVRNTNPDWEASSSPIPPEVIQGLETQIRGLQEQINDITYEAPTTNLTLNGGTTSVDLTGDSLTRTITGFTHKETNVDNIKGQLQFKYGSTTKNVNKSSTNNSETLSPSITVTFSSSMRNATFTLSGTSVKNVAFSDTATITSYYPAFYGALETKPTTTTIASLTKTSGTSISGTRTVTFSGSNKYVWFCTTGTISKITSSGFDVPFTQDGTLSYKGATYKLYRTSNLIAAGTHTFVVA